MKLRHVMGVSAGYHDAAVSVVRSDGQILFAAHSERYSKVKNDPCIHPALLEDAVRWPIDTVVFYERPWMHNLQQMLSGSYDWGPWTASGAIAKHTKSCAQLSGVSDIRCVPHHLSHAAAGFQTSPFESAAVVVIDAVGELDTVTIYRACYDSQGQAHYDKLWCRKYPHSIGLFYSAATEAVGLKPMEEEYITMGMSAYGSDLGTAWLRDQFVGDMREITFRENLHAGLNIDSALFGSQENLAACAQNLAEGLIMSVMERARHLTGSDNLVYMGGVALNCVANRRLGELFDQVWIMPNPGDAGSSLGAAAAHLGTKLNWQDAYLGHNIPGDYPVESIVEHLQNHAICGVASGRAEWGPRALGNRSLLADPRGSDIKDLVNEIKRRQKFRPFAPAILEELADDYFDMSGTCGLSRYMQSVARCRHPDLLPAIIHCDGTSRVQTVPRDGSGFRRLLEQWYAKTGCPMLLNTSLNIRGEPMVNDREDADRFERMYGVRVFS